MSWKGDGGLVFVRECNDSMSAFTKLKEKEN